MISVSVVKVYDNSAQKNRREIAQWRGFQQKFSRKQLQL